MDVVLVDDVLVERVVGRVVTSVDGSWVDDVVVDSEILGPAVVDEYLPPSKIQEINPIIFKGKANSFRNETQDYTLH